MKFIEVGKARSLKFNTPVFVRIDNDLAPAVGRMLKVEHTAQGVIRTFEVAGFSEDWNADGKMSRTDDGILLEPFTTTKVTHVCIPS